jgi:hypothetical protein
MIASTEAGMSEATTSGRLSERASKAASQIFAKGPFFVKTVVE